MAAYKEHACGGVVAYLTGVGCLVYMLQVATTKFTLFEWLLCALVGSLFPDIDIKSKGQRLVYSVLLLVSITCMMRGNITYAAVIATCALIPLIVRHRGICHEWWFAVGVVICMIYGIGGAFPQHIYRCLCDGFFFCLGVLSHLVLDGRIKW